MSESELRTLSQSELPEFFEQCRRDQRHSLALLTPDSSSPVITAKWYIAHWNWVADDIYLLKEPLSADALFLLLTVDSLQKLALPLHNLQSAGARAIAEKLPNLHTLDLGNNNLGPIGARAIAENLSKLHTLDLGNNSLGDSGARIIADKLTNLSMLDLGGNRLSDNGARAIASNLRNLHTLDLGNNNLGKTGARVIAAQLPNLHTLDLSNNNLGDAGARAIAEKLTNLHTLDLCSNGLSDSGARAIAGNLRSLYALELGGNRIMDAGTRVIADKLRPLHSLDLSCNILGDAGASFIADKLKNLRHLDLGGNLLTDDSVRILVDELPNLKTLGLFGNRVLRLPGEFIHFHTEAAALRDYFRRIDGEGKRKLNEAKLIVVGNEAVGKTALVNFLIKDEPCSDTDKTPGLHIEERIEVSRWVTPAGNDNQESLHLNVWDFGGQEVTRETHKLFLTARSLYLVVLEARRENAADAENVLHDWMRAIRHRGRDTVPVIVVVNKSEGDRELRLDETTLRKTYPIRAFIRTSCRDPKKHDDGGKGIVELRQKIVETIRQEIPQASAEFPLSYFDVKEQLRELAQAEHSFGVVRYTNICNAIKWNPVTTEEEQRRLLQLLVDIGVVIQHQSTTLLDPNWLTRAIYRLLTHADVVKNGGLFRVADLDKLLAGIQRREGGPVSEVRYPQDRWQYIVDQTVECGLSFEIPDAPGTYLMPEQLSPNALETGLERPDDPEVLRFRYDYADVPKGLMPRFIVQMHRYLSKNRTCWANGVVLYMGECKVLARSDRRQRWLNLYVHGPQAERREALRTVREGLERVHELFEELEAKAMVPVSISNKPDAAIPHSQLIEHERAGADFEKIPFEGKVFNVRELLGGIAPLPNRVERVDRNGNFEIHAGDGAQFQFVTGNRNDTSIDQSRPQSFAPAPTATESAWTAWLAPGLSAIFVAIGLGMHFAEVNQKWIFFVEAPALAAAIVYIVQAYLEALKQNWARRYAGICLAIASTCLLAPGIKLLVDFGPNSKIEAVLDHATLPAVVALAAACVFGWLQLKKDEKGFDQRHGH